ncbi:MAG: nitrile hydratase subunit beta [Burkholderiaceae bacterium]
MNGLHDMGGMQHYGPVQLEANEPLFHAPWEARAMALTVAVGATGQWNIDQSRSARESLPPREYLNSSYYEIWIRALERLMLARGMVSADELARGDVLNAPAAHVRPLTRDRVDAALARGTPADRPVTRPAAFAVGDRVRLRNMQPSGHTRLPRYVRGHVGTIEIVHGVHVYPDTHATVPAADEGHWLYSVRFDARELWGPQADPTVSVSVDAWEPYLERAGRA